MTTPFKSTRLLLLVTLGLLSPVHIAWGDPVASAPTKVVPVASQQALWISEVETDATLQAKVSFTAKAQPLASLLFDIQMQSGIQLCVSPDANVSGVKVTAYVQGLPLAQVLLGLSRLYGFRWAKAAENTFTLLPNDRSKLETGLLQIGDLNDFRLRFLDALEKNPDHMDWPQEVTKHVSEQELLKGGNPQVSSLPADLVSKIRKEKEQIAALRLIEMYHVAMEASVDDYVLRVQIPDPKALPKDDGKNPPPIPSILIRTQEGRGVTVLEGPIPLPLKPNTNNKNQPTNNIPGRT